MGDCLHELSQYETAHQEYSARAVSSRSTRPLEAPDLWRRLAENVADVGDSLYRDEETQQALPVYQLLMTDAGLASTSVLYTDRPSLLPHRTEGVGLAQGAADGTPLPS